MTELTKDQRTALEAWQRLEPVMREQARALLYRTAADYSRYATAASEVGFSALSEAQARSRAAIEAAEMLLGAFGADADGLPITEAHAEPDYGVAGQACCSCTHWEPDGNGGQGLCRPAGGDGLDSPADYDDCCWNWKAKIADASRDNG